MTVGQTVYLQDGRRGMIVGWQGDTAIVSLDADGSVIHVETRHLRTRL